MSEILNQFRDEDLPPSTVDVSGAVRVGRRRRRTRAVLAVISAAIVLAAGGVTAPLLLSARPGPDPAPPVQPTCGRPEPARPTMPTWQQFDPLSLEIDASGVEGFRVTTTGTSTYWQLMQLDGGDRLVQVFLFARGGEPRYLAVDGTNTPLREDLADGEPADPVGGTPAYWLADLPWALAWQWTPGAWILVFAERPEQDPSTVDADGMAELRAVATQVASQLELGIGTPVTSPFCLPVPDGMYPAFTATVQASDNGQEFPVSFIIQFNAVGTIESTHPFTLTDGRLVPPTSVAVQSSSFASLDDLPEGATEYPEDLGYPAYRGAPEHQEEVLNTDQEVVALYVFDVDGLGFQVWPWVPGTPDENVAFAADIFRTITVYPGAVDDPSAWGDPIAP